MCPFIINTFQFIIVWVMSVICRIIGEANMLALRRYLPNIDFLYRDTTFLKLLLRSSWECYNARLLLALPISSAGRRAMGTRARIPCSIDRRRPWLSRPCPTFNLPQPSRRPRHPLHTALSLPISLSIKPTITRFIYGNVYFEPITVCRLDRKLFL